MLVVAARVGVMSGRRARGSVTSVGGGGDGTVFSVLYGSWHGARRRDRIRVVTAVLVLVHRGPPWDEGLRPFEYGAGLRAAAALLA